MFVGGGSRLPGVMLLADATIRLPVPASVSAPATEVQGAQVSRPAPEPAPAAAGTLAATGPSGPPPVLGLLVLAGLLMLRRRVAR
jgi:MYXO-CTERM domain-containing protein